LANGDNVKVGTHPVHDDEFRFLVEGGLMRRLGTVVVARCYLLHSKNSIEGRL
jgi:hypothetical protein